MSWRTVLITNRCKLDLKMAHMVVRGEETKRIFLDEISMLIIENTAVSLTGCLIAALIERKIKVVFCDEKRNPTAELTPYVGSHDCSRKIKMQVGWRDDVKCEVWTGIVAEKIAKQAQFLFELGMKNEAELLRGYLREIEPGDTTNREGHAAKVYFNAIFGMGFTRSAECATNAALNYGYGLILSAFNREVAANGYLTQLGLHHDNVFNPYNLSCDLMEPYRILVDRFVREKAFGEFGTEEKHSMLNVLHKQVLIDGLQQTTINAIKLYTKSVFNALNDDDISCIKFMKI